MKILENLAGPLALALVLAATASAQWQPPQPPLGPGSWMGGPRGQFQGGPGGQFQGGPGGQFQGGPGGQFQGGPGGQFQGGPGGQFQGGEMPRPPHPPRPPECEEGNDICQQLAEVHEAMRVSVGQIPPSVHALVQARLLAENGMKDQAIELAGNAMREYDLALANLDQLSERIEALHDAVVQTADAADEDGGDDEESDDDEDSEGSDDYDDEVTDEADEVLEGF